MKTFIVKISATKEVQVEKPYGYGTETTEIVPISSEIHEAIVKYLYKNEYQVAVVDVQREFKKGKK